MVRVDGPAEDVVAALAAVPGIDRVERVERGSNRFILEGAVDGDAARATGEAMQRRGWPVHELREETLDLERIFLDLIAEGGRRS